MVVLLECSPISTEELWSSVRVTIQLLVTSLTKALLLRLLSLAERSALGRVLVAWILLWNALSTVEPYVDRCVLNVESHSKGSEYLCTLCFSCKVKNHHCNAKPCIPVSLYRSSNSWQWEVELQIELNNLSFWDKCQKRTTGHRLQCIRKVFRPLDFSHILLCYSLILKLIKHFFYSHQSTHNTS